ncbi:hypothetical protein RI367_003194 [Sorochytrium milnesiophthora]
MTAEDQPTSSSSLSVGIDVSYALADAHEVDQYALVDTAQKSGYSFIVVDFEARLADVTSGSLEDLRGPLRRSNLIAVAPEHATRTVCKMPAAWDFDSDNAQHRQRYEMARRRYVNWSSHVGISAVLMPFPTGSVVANHAHVLLSSLGQLPYTGVWQSVPLQLKPDDDDDDAAWKRWNTIRLLCGHSQKLRLALELTAQLPSDTALDRWLAEPIAAVVLPASIFTRNAKGFPVLSKGHQAFVRKLLKRDPYLIVSEYDPLKAPTGGLASYQQYLNHIYKTQPEPGVIERFASDYSDYLQHPLQPLMDNLEAQTYSVFEQDPVKYELYEKAVYYALMDKVKAEDKDSATTVIMVVGAGPRGPLVDCCLRASQSSQRAVKIYAVEKNPNALVSLQAKQESEWRDQVTVVFADMRRWKAPELCDILVSELLGSFGDNELSPECLDGVQRFLKPDGVSIPQSYTPFVAPLSSVKLFNEAAAFKDVKYMETPYVVMFRDASVLDEPKPCWVFEHPCPDVPRTEEGPVDNLHNTRYSCTEFTVKENAVVHGLAGYFECVLYKHVLMSIRPTTHSPNMTSWFPIYFPIRFPFAVPRGGKVQVHIWRCSNASKVWYEWCIIPESGSNTSYASLIHNSGGKSYFIGL